MRYKKTSPKLNTSDLKGFAETIFLELVLRSSGARKGTVPKMVAYSIYSLLTTLQLPTSQSFMERVLELRTRMFYGLISQCAILFFSKSTKASRRKVMILRISFLVNRIPSEYLKAMRCWRFIYAHSMTMWAYFFLEYWLISCRVTK